MKAIWRHRLYRENVKRRESASMCASVRVCMCQETCLCICVCDINGMFLENKNRSRRNPSQGLSGCVREKRYTMKFNK